MVSIYVAVSCLYLRYTCNPSKDGQWGSLKGNRWNGMVAEVLAGSADIIVASLDMTPERNRALDFLFPLSQTKYLVGIKL